MPKGKNRDAAGLCTNKKCRYDRDHKGACDLTPWDPSEGSPQPPGMPITTGKATKPSKKKREATPRSPKVSPAAVDAPPAPLKKAVVAQLGEYTGTKVRGEVAGSTPADSPNIPEELAPVWDGEIAKAFQALRPQQQDFLLCYLREGNAAAAYRHAYNKMAKDHLASVCGSQHLATLGISSILLKFASIKTEALFTIIHGYREMAQATKPNWVQDKEGQWENVGNDPDWQARKEAYLGMRKVHALDAPTEVKATHTIQSMTDDQLDAKIAAALAQAGAIAPAGGESPTKAHAQD